MPVLVLVNNKQSADTSFEVPRLMGPKSFLNGHVTMTTTLSGVVCHLLVGTGYDQPMQQI